VAAVVWWLCLHMATGRSDRGRMVAVFISAYKPS
jgi:hypothetical protein